MNSADNNFFVNGQIDLSKVYQHAIKLGTSSTPQVSKNDSFQSNSPEVGMQMNYLSPFNAFNPIQIDSKNILN